MIQIEGHRTLFDYEDTVDHEKQLSGLNLNVLLNKKRTCHNFASIITQSKDHLSI